MITAKTNNQIKMIASSSSPSASKTKSTTPLMQPYKAESNHRDYSTKASMDRARRFITSLKRVESIVTTSMQGNKDRIKQAHQILSNLDTNHTGILDRRTFSLACRRLQLGLSRTDIDALIAFLRSRKFASADNKRKQLAPGCLRWRWFLIQFCGLKYIPSTNNNEVLNNNGGTVASMHSLDDRVSPPSTSTSSPTSSSSRSTNSSGLSSVPQHDFYRVINNQRKRPQHRRPRTADTLKKARQRRQQKQQQRPASSGARDNRNRRRGGTTNNKNQQQRPTSVPYKKKRLVLSGSSPKRNQKNQKNQKMHHRPQENNNNHINTNNTNNGGGSLASMASALQRDNGQDWTFFGGGERRSHKDIANMMLRRPSSPSKAKTKRHHASPLLTARLRPFFGTVYNQQQQAVTGSRKGRIVNV